MISQLRPLPFLISFVLSLTAFEIFNKRSLINAHVTSYNTKLSNAEFKKFNQIVKNDLSLWIKEFKKNSQTFQIPWTLIAAVAYQESKWQPEATSYTGVKGLMQLTSQTALHLGIEDRKDPGQSLRGGSFYLAYLYDKTSSELDSRQRWIHALAAYNLGWGHVLNIYRLAKIKKIKATNWKNFKYLLGELNKSENKEHIFYGSARGHETIQFIEKVLAYEWVLNETFHSETKTFRDLR